MSGTDWKFTWDRGSAQVAALGGMVAPVEYRLDDGRLVQPFAVAPWADDTGPDHAALPGILKSLRGEWPCVPFGRTEAPRDLPERWLDGLGDDPKAVPGDDIHGWCSNQAWQLDGAIDNGLALSIDYPDGHPIRRLRRHVTGVPGQPRLDMSLEVDVRADARLPVGLHPVFRLPDEAGGAEIRFGGAPKVRSYPMIVEKDSRFLPDQQDMRLESVRLADGGTVDASRHPLPFDTEELLLVEGHDGRVDLRNHAEGYVASLTWDAAAFPSCLLWISNRGRDFYPWNSRFQALGVEPVAAPFDLGVAHAVNDRNPLARGGLDCAVAFKAGQTWRTDYSISVAAL